MTDSSQILYGFNVVYYPKDRDVYGNEIEPSKTFDEFTDGKFQPPYENVAIEAYCSFIGSDVFPYDVGITRVTLQDFPETLKHSLTRPVTSVVASTQAPFIPNSMSFMPKDGTQVLFDIVSNDEKTYSVRIENDEVCRVDLTAPGYGNVEYNIDNILKHFRNTEIYYDGRTDEVISMNDVIQHTGPKPLSDIMTDDYNSKMNYLQDKGLEFKEVPETLGDKIRNSIADKLEEKRIIDESRGFHIETDYDEEHRRSHHIQDLLDDGIFGNCSCDECL